MKSAQLILIFCFTRLSSTRIATELDSIMVLQLRCIGFCGVDDSVDPLLLSIISTHYQWVEWGILFRQDKEGQPRYPSTTWVQKLVEAKVNTQQIRIAAHLCGGRCQELLRGEYGFIERLHNDGFQRIQINATRANDVIVDVAHLTDIITNLKNAILAFPTIEWIIQCNDETAPIKKSLEQIHSILPNMSFLFDASCGTGVNMSAHPLPPIHATIPCGYAGGLGPETLTSAMSLLSSHLSAADHPSPPPIWVDMESSLREHLLTAPGAAGGAETRDVFSIRRCFQCIRIAADLLQLPYA